MNENSKQSGPKVYSVSQITKDIKAILEAAFDAVWIEGEISNLRVAASQHAYFVLKDSKSQIRCVLFKGYRAGLKYQTQDGDNRPTNDKRDLVQVNGIVGRGRGCIEAVAARL